jgi:LCP family protein required for cell wall assembly
MRRIGALLTAALVAWVTGAALGSSESVDPAVAAPVVSVKRAPGATHLPILGGRPIFILVLGSDARAGQVVSRERSDSIHLVGINLKEHRATILGFPRDSWVSIPGRGSARINSAMVLGGPELAVATVESITGIQIDYYALTSFWGLRRMIDAVGGVVVDVPYPMSDYASGAAFDAGPQRLTGAEALAFARNRKDTPTGDFSRSQNQGRLMLGALAEFQKDFLKDPAELLTWIGAGMRNMDTDLPLAEILSLAFTASRIPPSAVNNVVVPGSVGLAGSASVVYISGAANSLYADMRGDGLIT